MGMKNFFKYMIFIRFLMIVMFFTDSISMHTGSPGMIILLTGISLFLFINDYGRYYKFYRDEKKYAISTAASLFAAIVALQFDRGYIFYYFFAIFPDIIELPEGWKKILVCVHVCTFAVIMIIREFGHYGSNLGEIFTIESIMKHTPNLMFMAFIYGTSLMSFFAFSTLMRERYETSRLNKELTQSNSKLKEYAEKVEELAVSKERNRVAQEIHDSLGHSITALIMHLDFLEKIMDNDSEKAREVVIKTQSMARDSMGVLRSAVYALKEDRHTKGLTESVNELISKITSMDGIDIDFLCTGNIEGVSLDIKNMVYRTIQEGVTNGIKHGKATKFKISIISDNSYFTLLLKDNGLGCSGPVKGNGLNGIEERVNALGGEISYLNEDGFGFNISIPIEEAIS